MTQADARKHRKLCDIVIKDREFYKTILKLSLPTAFQTLMSLLVVMTVNVMVSRVETEGLALAAVSQSNSITNFVNASLTRLAGGSIVLISQYGGKKNLARIRPIAR